MKLAAQIKDLLIVRNIEIESIVNDKTNKNDSSITLIVKKGNDSTTFNLLNRISQIEVKTFEANKFHITKK